MIWDHLAKTQQMFAGFQSNAWMGEKAESEKMRDSFGDIQIFPDIVKRKHKHNKDFSLSFWTYVNCLPDFLLELHGTFLSCPDEYAAESRIKHETTLWMQKRQKTFESMQDISNTI